MRICKGLYLSLAFSLVLVAAAFAEPVVNNGGVVNGASFAAAAVPHSGIAQGSIFAVFGTGLGPAQIAHASDFPLPTELAGTSVQVTSGGATLDAFVLYTKDTQVGAILPSATPPGAASLTVTFNGETSAPVSFEIVQSAFGIFTTNSRGSGPAVAHYTGLPGRVYNSLVTPAFPDILLTLWGTGLGPIGGPDNQPPNAGNLSADVQVFVGGQPAEVLYGGRSPCCAGVDQINIRVPDVANNCYVPVEVEVNGVPSNFATIAVSDDLSDTVSLTEPCSDPNGFSQSELQTIRDGGEFHVGTIRLTRLDFGDDNAGDEASATFGLWDASTLLQGKFNFGAVAAGHCVVSGDFFDFFQYVGFPLTELLGAGPSLTLSGPDGTTQLGENGWFSQYDSFGQQLTLSPGPYTMAGTGGADVGPFQAGITIPAPAFDWTSRDSIQTIPRSEDLLITWSGGDPNSLVEISGVSNVSQPSFLSHSFQCTAHASDGQFTVPAAILSRLPASSGTISPPGRLSVSNTVRGQFQATGLDFGIIEAVSTFSREVIFQ